MSSVIKNFFIYSASALMLRSASIIVAPLTLQVLSPADYGLVSLLYSFSSVVTILIGFGLRQVLSIEFFHCSGAQQRTLINTLLCAYVVLATPLLIGSVVWCTALNRYIFDSAVPTLLMVITLLYCFIFFFVEFLYQILRYQEKVVLVTRLQTICALTIIIFNSVLLVWYNAGIYSGMTSYCLGYAGVCLWGIYRYMHSGYTTSLTRSDLLHIPRYLCMGLPFMPTMLCNWILSSSDRWLLAHMTTLHEVGIYALADSVGQLYLLIIMQPLSHAYLPRLMHSFKNQATMIEVEKKNRRQTMYGMLIGITVLSISYVLTKPFAMLVLPNAYHKAIECTWYILMSYIVLTGTYCFSAVLQFQKCRWFLSGSLVAPAVCNGILNVVLIPVAGVGGCVIATLSAQLLYCIITYWYGGRILKGLVDVSGKMHATHVYSHVETPSQAVSLAQKDL